MIAALDVFHRLIDQVDEIEAVAARVETEDREVAAILRRSGFLLAVAALDAYFHERGIALLHWAALQSHANAVNVANYLRSVSASDVSGSTGDAHIRLRLSFKTLVSPGSIDTLLTTATLNADQLWLGVALEKSSRPDRMKLLLNLLYDRRNQIAHEADWDPALLNLRPMEQVHLSECVAHVRAVVEGMDHQLAPLP